MQLGEFTLFVGFKEQLLKSEVTFLPAYKVKYIFISLKRLQVFFCLALAVSDKGLLNLNKRI